MNLHSTIFKLLPSSISAFSVCSSIYILLYLNYYCTIKTNNPRINGIYILLYLNYYDIAKNSINFAMLDLHSTIFKLLPKTETQNTYIIKRFTFYYI